MSDVVTSWLRTVVPGLYSAAITALLTWAATEVPWLAGLLDTLHIDPLAPGTVLAVVALVLAAWHALWRRVEPRLPDWLTRVVLGSAASPVYLAPGAAATVYTRFELGTLSGSAGDTPVPVAPGQSFTEAAALALDPTTRTVVTRGSVRQPE